MKAFEGAPAPIARVLFRVVSLALGGSERRLCNLAASLDRERFEIVVWCDYTGPLEAVLQAAGIRVHCMLLPMTPGPDFDRCVEWIRSIHPAIYQSWTLRGDPMDVVAAAEAGVPAIVTSRGNIRHWDRRGAPREWERYRNSLTHLIIANSLAVAEVTQRIEDVPSEKIRVIHNGTPAPAPSHAGNLRAELRFTANTPVIGIVGNLRKVKGHDVLLRAFHRLLETVPTAKLVAAGANHEFDGELEQLWRDLRLQYSVYFLAVRPDIETVYGGLDLYVHASRAEGLPNAVMEAMSHGVPVVATSVGGVPELIEDGVHGLLVPPDEPAALTAAMLRMLSQPDEARRLGLAGRERIQTQFSVDRMARAFEAEYSRLLAASPQPSNGAH